MLGLLPHQYPHKFGKLNVMYEEHINAIIEMEKLAGKRTKMEHEIEKKKMERRSNTTKGPAF